MFKLSFKPIQNVLVLLSLTFVSINVYSNSGMFPIAPDSSFTPGDFCKRPVAYRYAERIPICDRNVSASDKRKIIANYDNELGYKIKNMDRGDFKIDHFIPLSIGGSNDESNLWPQHKSVYIHTDPVESEVSELMRMGRIKQAQAIKAIKDCKFNLNLCESITEELKALH